MRIGIDAKWYFDGPPSGRLVIKNIVDELLKRDNFHQIYLILDKKFSFQKGVFIRKNIYPVFVWSRNNLLSNLFILPIIAKIYKLDLIVYQYFSSFFGKHKKIVYIHDVIFQTNPEYFTLKERIYFSPMKFLARLSDGIITVSKSEMKRIIKNKFLGRNKKIKVIYNGVDERFKPKEYFDSNLIQHIKLKYNLPERFILYVGRLNERKNVFNLLRAVSLLNDKEIKLVLVGNYDWKMFNIPKILNELNLYKRVLLLGYVNDEDLPIIYSLATVFCFVSFDEGFGLPALEAMTSGVPIVVSGIDSLVEVCGDAGFYCNPNNPIEIATRIESILSIKNKDIVQNKIKIGLQRSKLFSWKKSVEKIVEFCESIGQNA
jgi:glycosyltransferase involved in cell wall biosynthesis